MLCITLYTEPATVNCCPSMIKEPSQLRVTDCASGLASIRTHQSRFAPRLSHSQNPSEGDKGLLLCSCHSISRHQRQELLQLPLHTKHHTSVHLMLSTFLRPFPT